MNKVIICKECGENKPHKAFGLCVACYDRQRIRPHIHCEICGEWKEHKAFSMCDACYRRTTGQNVRKYNRQRATERHVRALGEHTNDEWLQLLANVDYKCVKCNRKDVPLERDHIVPIGSVLLKDGTIIPWSDIVAIGSDVIANIQPLCKPCNVSKLNYHAVNYKKEYAHGQGQPEE